MPKGNFTFGNSDKIHKLSGTAAAMPPRTLPPLQYTGNFMLVWQGLGILGPLICFFVVIAVQILFGATLGDEYTTTHAWTTAVAMLVAAAASWYAGVRLNNAPGRELIVPATQERVILRKRHTLFWIPMQYIAVVMVVLAVVTLFK